MGRKYTKYTPEKKFQVALEAAANRKSVNQIASDHGVHPSQVSEWKGQLLKSGVDMFRLRRKARCNESEDVAYLQQQIGRLTVELEWLKKKQGVV